jgi:type IV pilus assembly protein PilV
MNMGRLAKRQRGVGLIEVLVTVLIIATALLTLSAMQMRSLQFNQSAYLRSQANILAYDIIDRMRLNRTHVTEYVIDYDADAPSGTSLAEVDLREWRDLVEDVLPEGLGQVKCNSSGICTISIRWSEQNQSENNDEDIATFEYTTRV